MVNTHDLSGNIMDELENYVDSEMNGVWKTEPDDEEEQMYPYLQDVVEAALKKHFEAEKIPFVAHVYSGK